MVTLEKMKEAKKRLNGVVHKTPLIHASFLSKQWNSNIYLKKENLQLTGSFKIRGAFNKLSLLDKEQKRSGVVAASAGNHAQGIAYSANYLNIQATVVMPEITPLTKVMGVKTFGAEVILYGSNFDEAYIFAKNYAKEQNKLFVHPFSDDDVINGQGTIGIELLEQIDDMDMILIPIGGGGLITGVAKALKKLKPSIKIVGIVASGANAMKESFYNNSIIEKNSVKTIADGIAVKNITPKMLDYVLDLVDEIVEVEDNEIASAILFLLEKQKILVEGAGASGFAAIMHGKVEVENKNVVVLISGGNIDVTILSVIIEKGLVKSNRKMNMIVKLSDNPGALMKLSNIFKECATNIVQIDYDRNSVQLEYGEANVTLSLETKSDEHQDTIREKLLSEAYSFKEIL